MSDENKIDRLFREQLGQREIAPQTADWNRIEAQLNQGGSSGKWWLTLGALILISCAVVMYLNTRSSDTAMDTLNHDSTGAQSTEQTESSNPSLNNPHSQETTSTYTPSNTSSNPNNVSSAGNSNDTPLDQHAVQTDNHSDPSSDVNPDLSLSQNHISSHSNTPGQKTSKPSANSSATRTNNSFTKKKNNEWNDSNLAPTSADNASFSSNSDLNKGSNGSNKPNDHSTNSFVSKETSPTNESNQTAQNQKGDDSLDDQTLMDFLQSKNGLKLSAIQSKSATALSTAKPATASAFSKSPPLPSFSRFKIESGLLVGASLPQLEGEGSIIEKRKKEETATIAFGVDAMLNWQFRRHQFGSGVQYFNFGENVNYTSEIEKAYTEYDTTYQYIQTTEVIYDTTFVGGIIQVDSFTVVTTDSIPDVLSIDTVGTVKDESLVIHNGRNAWKIISIPLRYTYIIPTKTRGLQLMLSAGLHYDMLIQRRGYVLQSSESGVIAIDKVETIRNQRWSWMLGLGSRYMINDRTYILGEVTIRQTMGSWNTQYDQRYFTPALRLGIGVRL